MDARRVDGAEVAHARRPGRLELAERRDALVERLTGQLATLEEELEQARGAREEAEAAQAALALRTVRSTA